MREVLAIPVNIFLRNPKSSFYVWIVDKTQTYYYCLMTTKNYFRIFPALAYLLLFTGFFVIFTSFNVTATVPTHHNRVLHRDDAGDRSLNSFAGPAISSSENELIFEVVTNQQAANSQTNSFLISNTGDAPLTITQLKITGAFASQFSAAPQEPKTIAPGGSLSYSVTYAPELDNSDLGYQPAALEISSNDSSEPTLKIGLFGLKKSGLEGTSEPALNDVVKTLGININVGWSGLTTSTDANLKGEEVNISTWKKTSTATSVNIIPVGRYSPAELLPFGWYTNTNGKITPNEVGVVNDGLLNAQRLYPTLKSGTANFNPGTSVFGLYVYSNSFNRFNYSQDEFNTDGVAHRTRTYPLKDRQGNIVPNSYFVTIEDATNGDYQDYMFIIRNVEPSGPDTNAIKVNFATTSAAVPAGYFNDTGLPYSTKSNGYSYGWLNADTNKPADLSDNSRDRQVAGVSVLQNTLIHMQYGNISNVSSSNYLPNAKWEMEVPNGTYQVTLGVGDPLVDTKQSETPSHTINVEDVTFIDNFKPTGAQGAATRFKQVTAMVGVNDGKLSIDATGGFNTKIDFVELRPTEKELPFFTNVTPKNRADYVPIKGFQINVEIRVPDGYELDKNTTAGNVQLFEITDNGNEVLLPSNANDTGGGDAITLTPTNKLKANTTYAFRIKNIEANRIGDLNDRLPFLDFESTFTTGAENVDPPPSRDLSGVAFTKVLGGEGLGEGTKNQLFSSLVIGPDGKLYASTLGDFQSDGKIQRWDILPDGTLANLEVLSPQLNGAPDPVNGPRNNNNRIIIGLVFDPASTADNLIAYVTHSMASVTDGPEWDGVLTRLSGPKLSKVQDMVIHLPRSKKDHLTNSIIFDKQGVMYISQGSNTAGGDPDPVWGMRKERLLSGATLRLDLGKMPANLPLDAYTTSDISVINNAPDNSTKMSDGTYNPYATNSPLTIFATGIRNAYDLLWHSNGWLYLPTNGTAGNNNNSPITPATSKYALARRLDGRTNVPAAPSVVGGETQKDWLFKTKGGTYNGHPNPYRGEFVLNHGGTSYTGLPGQASGSHVDVKKYSSSIGPDPNYMEPAYDFGFNKSPDGVIEYKSNAFGGKLKGLIMVTRFSGQDDILAMEPSSNGDIGAVYSDISGLSGFDDPLDVIEDTKTGNLYVSEYDRDNDGTARLTLLRAKQPATKSPLIASNESELLFETVINDQGPKTQTKKVTIMNDGEGALNISSVALQGNFADQFQSITPVGAQTLQPGEQLTYSVTYAPDVNTDNLGYQDAKLVFANNSVTEPKYEIGLFALKKQGFGGDTEPPLQDIVNTLGLGINVGWTTLTTDTSNTPKGEETKFQQWIQATDAPVTITPVGRYSPAEELPFGWYTNEGDLARNQVGVLDTGEANAQRIYPPLKSGTTSFDPKGGLFGIYLYSNYFERYSYTQDALNKGDVSHRVRTYAVKDRNGNAVENSYLVTFEDADNGDYQDYMFVISNVLPYNQGDLSLSFDKEEVNFNVIKNNGTPSNSAKITLSSSGAISPGDIQLKTSQPWIVLPQNVKLNEPMDFNIDAAALAPGSYTGTISASAKNYSSAVLQVSLTVTGELNYAYQFNFQDIDDKEVSPQGYVDDFGSPYGLKTTVNGDLTYGWVKPGTLTPASAEMNGRNRNTPSDRDVLVHTFNLIGHRSQDLYPTRDWVFSIPNGSYYVNISVGGDPDYSDSNHVLNVNGTNVISFDEQNDSSGRNTYQDTKLVTVTDGLMRLSLGQGGVNAKIDYLRIAPQDETQRPPTLTATFDGITNEPDNYRGSVKVTLSAEAATSDGSIASITYSLDGNADVEYTAPLTIAQVGSHQLSATATDANGNTTTNKYNFRVEQASGATVFVENMTKIPGTQRAFPADDYYTFSRLGKIRYAGTKFHDSNVMRINNTGTSNLVVSAITVSDTTSYRYEILDSDNSGSTLPLSIAPGKHKDLKLTFIGATTNGLNKLFKETISLKTNADNSSLSTATLHGAFSPQPEQDGNGISDEVSAQQVFNAFGFKTNMQSIVNDQGTITPPNTKPTHPTSFAPKARNIIAGYEGDLILAKSFVQADPSAPIHVIQMSGLHGYTTANARFVQVNGTGTVGGVSATQSKDYYQSLLPANTSGQLNSDSATRITEPFRIAIEGYLNTGGNNLNGRNPAVLGLRVYKVIDRDGKVVPNEYIALQDYVQNGCGAGSANCDWNDDTFYFTNIRPQEVPTSSDIAPYFAEAETPFTYDVTYAFDEGYPGNKLTYSAVMQDGSPLPAWLTFDSLTGTFSGNPPMGSENPYSINVKATDLNGITTTSVATITVSEKGSLADISLKINAGGPTETYNNKEFVTDTYFKNGKSFTNNSAAVPTLFKTERSDAKNFGYNIPVPNGLYTVTMHFAEIYWGANGGGPGGIGKRVFDVNLEDKLVLDNYDITKDVGSQKPVEKTYVIDVEDGVINLNLSSDAEVGGVNFPMISALEVVSGKPVNKAPKAIASGTPTEGYAPLPVSFTGNKSTDDEGVTAYNWSLNGESLSTKADFDYNFKDPGTYDVILTVTDREGLESMDTVNINVQDPGRPEDFAIRINAGGPTLTYEDKEFIADTYFTTGKTFTNTKATVPDLYQSERSADPPTFGYAVPVPNGKYTVVLHFAEIYFGANGGGTGGAEKRIFDVSIEDSLALNNYDIFADVGPQTPVTKTFKITVKDRILNIDLSALGDVGGKDQPKISAIEILGVASPNQAPTALATADIQQGAAPLNVNFVGSNSTDDKGIVSYNWKIDGVSVSDQADFTNEFTEIGNYSVSLEVTDVEGLSDVDSLNIEVTEIGAGNQAPVAVATSDVTEGSLPLEVSFKGEKSNDDVGIERYSWKIDTNEVSTAPNFVYTFENLGNYQVTLTVTDADGLTDADTLNIKVTNPNGIAPTAIATSNVSQGNAPLDVSFTGEESTDDIGIESYSWKINGEELSTAENFDHTFSKGGIYDVTLTVTDADNLSDTATLQITVNTPNTECMPVPDPWTAKDIGEVTTAGSTCYNDGTFEINATGNDISGTDDKFHFVYQTLTGDGVLIARLQGLAKTDPIAKAGIMMRSDLTPNAAHAMLAVEANPLSDDKTGHLFQYRTAEGSATQSSEVSSIEFGLPYYLKLVRSGNIIKASVSLDNKNWTPVSSQVIEMGDTIYLGMAVTSNQDGNLTKAIFDQVSIKPGPQFIAQAEGSPLEGPANLEVDFDFSINPTDIAKDGLQAYWQFEDGTTSDLANPVHMFTEPGVYTVNLRVTNAQGQSDVSQVTVNVLPAEEGDPEVFVYPNPKTSDQPVVTVEIRNAPVKITQITLIDSRGRIIQFFKSASGEEKNKLEMNLPILESGMYLLRIEDDNGNTYRERLLISNR